MGRPLTWCQGKAHLESRGGRVSNIATYDISSREKNSHGTLRRGCRSFVPCALLRVCGPMLAQFRAQRDEAARLEADKRTRVEPVGIMDNPCDAAERGLGKEVGRSIEETI